MKVPKTKSDRKTDAPSYKQAAPKDLRVSVHMGKKKAPKKKR